MDSAPQENIAQALQKVYTPFFISILQNFALDEYLSGHALGLRT